MKVAKAAFFDMHKSLIVLIAGVIIVMSLTLASYTVFMRFQPQREIGVMMRNMARLESFAYDLGLSWSVQEAGAGTSTTLYSSGEIASRETGDVDQATRFRAVRLSRDQDYSDLSGEIRHVNGKTYLTYAPTGPAVPGVDFDGKTWVSFEQDELASWGEVLPALEVPLVSLTPGDSWTTDGLKRLRVLLSVADVARVQYNGLTEIIDGSQTRIIDGRFDADAIEAFLLDLVRAKYGEEPGEDERILAHAQAAQLARLSLRFWVGMDDHLLYRLQAQGEFAQKEGDGREPVEARIEFSRFNEVVSIVSPTALNFGDIYRLRFGSLPSSGEASLSVKTLVPEGTTRLPVTQVETSADLDGDGLDNVLETFYGTSQTNADTDGDGVNDGDEVRAASNPRGGGSLFGFGLK